MKKMRQGENRVPYNRDVCFFCDAEGGYRQPLRTVSTLSAGSSPDAAVKKEGDGT